MYAIIRSGSKQYIVRKGDVIQVDLLGANPGDNIELKDVLFVAHENGQTHIGAPTLSNCKVQAKYLGEVKGEKIQSIKYKRRKNDYRKFGHRQRYAKLQIVDIVS